MATRNLFKGAQIQFAEALLDHSAHNSMFDRDGFRQFMLPACESSVQFVERELASWMSAFGCKWEREFTARTDGIVTMYISSPKVLNTQIREKLAALLKDGNLSGVKFGAVKTDATFVASH